jgi:hypothetical protein
LIQSATLPDISSTEIRAALRLASSSVATGCSSVVAGNDSALRELVRKKHLALAVMNYLLARVRKGDLFDFTAAAATAATT